MAVRLGGWTTVLAAGPVLLPAPALAHGVELSRSDAPVPVEAFLVGSAVVMLITFVGIGVLWQRPRLQALGRPRPLRGSWWGAGGGAAAAGGLGALLLVVIAGLAGGDRRPLTVAPVLVWIGLWLAVPFASALLGNLWSFLNPWRTVGKLWGLGSEEQPRLLLVVGVWPAAAVLVAAGWFELIYPDPGSGRALAVAALGYTVYCAAAMSWAGRETGLQIGDAFTTVNRLASAVAPWGRDAAGRLVRRGWLRSLPSLPRWRGLAAFVVAMIGIVTYDGLSSTVWWRDRLAAMGINSADVAVGTVGLLLVIGMLGIGYWLSCAIAAYVADDGRTPAQVASSFAHTLVPIALAYAFAHYFTLVVFEGQLLLITASDPPALGWNLLGTADWNVTLWLGTTPIWYVQVAAILGGHVLAVVLAHDRAIASFPKGRALRSQYAMLSIMIALTVLGLGLLAAG